MKTQKSEDGYELHFGTHHLSHAFLIKLLVPPLEVTAKGEGDVRIVSLISAMVKYYAPKSGIQKYAQSKLANALYVR